MLLLAALALPAQAQTNAETRAKLLPGVGGADARVTVDSNAAPWSGVARLQIPGVARCSAVVLAPRLVLTAAHCLWNRGRAQYVQAPSVHVLARYDHGGFASHSIGTRYSLLPGYDPRRPDATRDLDVAVVQLAEPLAATPLGLATASLTLPAAAMLGGYNQDRIEVLEADTACQVLASGALLLHSCNGTHGSSGGALLVRDAGGPWRLAGLQVGARIGGAGGVAVPAATLQDALARAGTRP